MHRSYSEMIRLATFEERFEYLRLRGFVGRDTFGHDRFMNQLLYRGDRRWKKIRDEVILRDGGCDLGMLDYPIPRFVVVHHITPITADDIERDSSIIFNLDNLICVSDQTHKAIHYGNDRMLSKKPVIRTAGDTSPWR